MVDLEWGDLCWGEVSTLVCQLSPNLPTTTVAKKQKLCKEANYWQVLQIFQKIILIWFCIWSDAPKRLLNLTPLWGLPVKAQVLLDNYCNSICGMIKWLTLQLWLKIGHRKLAHQHQSFYKVDMANILSLQFNSTAWYYSLLKDEAELETFSYGSCFYSILSLSPGCYLPSPGSRRYWKGFGPC